MQQTEQPEIVSIVDRICDILVEHNRHPEVIKTKWYDICFPSSTIEEISENDFYKEIRSLAGDYFGEFFWAHSEQHIYIWFEKIKKEEHGEK